MIIIIIIIIIAATDHKVKMKVKESKKVDKYLDIVRELKKS